MAIPDKSKLAPGLYLVATPIGNARDITLRALDMLRDADVLAAEDTRSLRRLMELHGISVGDRPLLAYHEHNGAKMRPRIVAEIAAGKSVLYASEAGTPMISDPGFDLARAVTAEGLEVTTAPGVSAVVTALTLAGLPTDRFFFAGFLPNASGARKSALRGVSGVEATLAFYESPRRVAAMLTDAAEILGDRPAAVCRELTKKFEEIRRGTLSELAASFEEAPAKGEIVVLVGKGDSEKISELDIEQQVNLALETMSVRDAADFVSAKLGVKRRPVYQLAMRLSEKDDG
ncbi:16S rRNA (cytidine(1402)-2'-O)-methyltransferase [Tropicibacter naphthalenivorans]|uniref:Ribosomal RNA small subunit methyltransferase I n=1 Tax=Tropicibacter naphthalenivorans TaxID=441103 RepID=A0A0P1GB68_9RHOB|nr:16S rRNA (cytidine(1402)-2'-O)-methyltransferase [Tropicibacter naphthalenivorans]CUH78686.1 Ribosomal RNA small subunit methyltransferase I [Tropicibacter naphthalenivorans]SMC81236.1 16S rRNA (cytidine1402-2'-O)-methyltransferase [Tropicibacter naphthalenivorans]